MISCDEFESKQGNRLENTFEESDFIDNSRISLERK